MKTLAWKDNADPRGIYYIPKTSEELSIFNPKRHERNIKLLQEVKDTGNISIYMLKGNKIRFLFSRAL